MGESSVQADESPGDQRAGSDREQAVDSLERALEEAEDDEAAYWIRTGLQHLLIDAEGT